MGAEGGIWCVGRRGFAFSDFCGVRAQFVEGQMLSKECEMDPGAIVPPLDMSGFITGVAWVAHDLAAMWAVMMAGIALLVALVGLLARGRVRVDYRIVESGGMAWLIAASLCSTPLDTAVFLPRSMVIAALVMSGLIWGAVLFMRWATSRSGGTKDM